MGTYKIHADLDVDGEVKGTSLDINGNGDISGTLTAGGAVTIPEYIVHASDTNTFFGFSAADTFKIAAGGEDVLRVNGGATTNEAAVSILCGGGTNATNIGLLLSGNVNGETLKLKINNPNTSGTLTGAGILSYEPDGDTFHIGQSTTHNNMAIKIDNSENVTLINALTVTGNITANGNIVGDDSTNITNINGIQCDSVLADGDSTTGILLATSDVQIVDGNEDIIIRVQDDQYTIGQTSSTNSAVKGRVTLKNRELAITSNTDGNADGDIVYFGSTTSMDTGKIYYYTASGTWALTDADAVATADGLIGVALGSASNTNGVLIKGMVTLDHDPGTVGDPIYLSTTAGTASSTAPSGSGDIVRVVGYCLNSSNGQIYFNPSGTFVEVA